MENREDKALKIAKILNESNPNPKTELVYKNEYELVVAVMLSAQTTDKKVNQITPKLFEKYSNWEYLASADSKEVQNLIREVNFYIGKSERLIKAAKYLLINYQGNLPKTIVQLIKIPGIARKSANVILQVVWGIAEGIVVDTHVSRVSQRLGLTINQDPIKIEKDLMQLLPKEYWSNFSGTVVLHGRYICTARKPRCGECNLNTLCDSAFKIN